MPDFTVGRYGTDSSGRPIYMTAYMHAWFERVVDELGFRPTIVQGAFMVRVPGGGADASAGYHDAGGCLDVRTWDLSPDQSERLVRTLRRFGAAAWRRDERHNMDPHLHLVLGTDKPLSGGALSQWRDYLAGHDGLAGHGPDYEWRPSPLVTTPPEDDMPWTEEDLRKFMREEIEAALNKPREVTGGDGKNKRRSLVQQLREVWQR